MDHLLNLYDPAAVVQSCEGDAFRAQSGIEGYWRTRLADAATEAFAIDAITTNLSGVALDHRGYNGPPVRAHFPFTEAGRSF